LRRFIKWITLLFSSLLLMSCGTLMQDVMRSCDRGQNFDVYAYCIKATYSQSGNRPNSSSVRAFYANLDMISEAYREKRVSDAQAKSMAYDSFMRTVQAENDRKDVVLMNQLNYLNQQNQQPRTPIQTNCVRNGQYTNCTSY
jgi:hypothetical protein